MKVEKKDTFDPSGGIWIKNERRIESMMPMDRQHDLKCGGCGEAWELADDVLKPNLLFDFPAYCRHPIGIKCPKCGLHQAVGQLSRLSIWEIPPPREHKKLNEIAVYADNVHLFRRKVKTPQGEGEIVGWKTVFEVSYTYPNPAAKEPNRQFEAQDIDLA